jgi:hypothetical protein
VLLRAFLRSFVRREVNHGEVKLPQPRILVDESAKLLQGGTRYWTFVRIEDSGTRVRSPPSEWVDNNRLEILLALL